MHFLIHHSVKIDPSEGFLRSGNYPVLTVMSAGHALHVFVNGQLAGQNMIKFLLHLVIYDTIEV